MWPPRTRNFLRLLATACLGAIGSLALVAEPAEAISNAGSDSRTLPDRVFAPDSFWYRRLPERTPVDPNSAAMIKQMYASGVAEYGNTERNLPSMNINTTDYTPPIYIARNTDPVINFGIEDCEGKGHGEPALKRQLTGIHIPAGALPAAGTDAELTVYNADTHAYTDTWVTKRRGGAWTACWGGTIADATTSSGTFPHPFGATAAGLALEGGVIKADELRRGEINHVVGMALPVEAVNARVSQPANRTDGDSSLPGAIAEGQLVRLPASLDLDAMRLNPTARAMARAAQRYGFIVWDRSGGITFRAENPTSLRGDPYPRLFGGVAGYQVMWGDPGRGEQAFPFDRLQVLPLNYTPPANGARSESSPASKAHKGKTSNLPSTVILKWLISVLNGTRSRD